MGRSVRASASQGKANSSLVRVSGQLVGGIRGEESVSVRAQSFHSAGPHSLLLVTSWNLFTITLPHSPCLKRLSHREIQEDTRRNKGRSMQGVQPLVRTGRVARYMTRVAFWTAVCSREDFQKSSQENLPWSLGSAPMLKVWGRGMRPCSGGRAPQGRRGLQRRLRSNITRSQEHDEGRPQDLLPPA